MFKCGQCRHVGLRLVDSQESSFESWKRSYMASSVLQDGRFANFQQLFFILQNFQIWALPNCKCVYLLIVRNGIFRLRKVQISKNHPAKRVDFLMLSKRVFRVRNVEICAGLSSMMLIC